MSRRSPPLWFKLTRTNSTFTGFVSTNGANWLQVGTANVSMPVTVYAGLAVCARNASAPNASTFDHVTLPRWPAAVLEVEK